MTTEPTSPRKLINRILLSTGRMEALTDGIFAIAMTLLVLELKSPDLPKSIGSRDLLSKLGQEFPAFFSFIVSFLYCGVLWVMHHLALHFIRHFQLVLVWFNLLFLMAISLIPFSCALLGHFLRTTAAREIYFANLFIASALLALQWVVAKRRKLVHEEEPLAVKAMGQRLMFLPPAMIAAMALTPVSLNAGFGAMALVLLALRMWQRRALRGTATLPSPAKLSS